MCTCVHHPHTVGLMVFSYVHHPHRKLWWYFSFVCVCVCWVYSTLPTLGFQVMIWPTTWRKFPPYLYKFCTHYSGEWVQGKSPLSQTLILKLPRTNKKKEEKWTKFLFYFILFYFIFHRKYNMMCKHQNWLILSSVWHYMCMTAINN